MILPNLSYVLVSSDNALYQELAFISIYSAKHHKPDAFAPCAHSVFKNIKKQNDNES